MNEGIKQHEVVSFFQQNKLDLLGINESRIRFGNFSTVSKRRFSAFQIIHNYPDHPNGRLWAIWRRGDLQVRLLSSGSQWLHLHVVEDARPVFITFVYGLNDVAGRGAFWGFLKTVSTSLPWVVLGDFNCVRLPSERISCVPPLWSVMTDFNNAIYDSGLEESATTGCEYTWTNKQDGLARKWMRLDRALVNSDWLAAFLSSSAEALPAGVSDHSPVVVSFNTDFCPRPKQFKFLNCWAQNSLFLPLVADIWKVRVIDCPIFRLVSRLKLLKPKLKTLHVEHYSNITERVIHLRGQLLDCQSRVQLDPLNQSLLDEEADLAQIFCRFKKVELNIAYQRAKVHDIKMMDASTSYFFAKIAARRNACNINTVLNTRGDMCRTFEDISDAFLDYYKSLLGTTQEVSLVDSCILYWGPKLSTEEGASLLASVTDEEVRCALFSIDTNKSPGPDGYSSGFFRSAWSIIVEDFTKAVKIFSFLVRC
ncbi:hypothetical protein RND81_04G076900 [Saponaria officinalis]|uniref:Endonuclease/exonuclease/phosphatase domain-containing protein n=1 Tax=Saponaria officinalis TaxID=3572 RepID=A0AAW1LHD5_SAPOF